VIALVFAIFMSKSAHRNRWFTWLIDNDSPTIKACPAPQR
jgi:hypothetical protein